MMKFNLQVFLILFLYTAQGMFAQAGVLDYSFGDDGKKSTVFTQYHSSIRSMVMQSDGKIIAAGTVNNQTSFSQFGLVRYNVDGSIDNTFGNEGKVISDFIDTRIALNSMALQSDGKIILSGIIYNNFSDSQFLLVRFDKNGQLDTSFCNNGIVIRDFVNINSIIIQPDDKILAAGFSFANNNRDYNLIRYNADGTLDTDFGNNGVASLSISDKDFWYDVALKSDGKIVCLGTSKNDSGNYNSDFAIMQYDNDGTLDEDFGENGIVIIDDDDIDVARALKIQPDGKIIFVGWSYSNSSTDYYFKMIRLLSNGMADESFGNNGNVVVPISLNLSSESIDMQSDGKIVLAGFLPKSTTNDIALVRFDANGEIDKTFGGYGFVSTHFEASSQANSICIQPNGMILVSGESGTVGGKNEYNPNFALLRYISGTELSNKKFNTLQYNFSVIKNPSQNKFELDFNLNESESFSMNLYDINGKKVSELIKNKKYPSGRNLQKIELPDSLANGLYFITISNGNSYYNVKVVK